MSEWMLLTILVLTGLALIAVDFYLPGFVLGSIGILLFLVSLYVCYHNHGVPLTIGLFIFELTAGVSAAYLSIQYFPQTAIGKKMILTSAPIGQRSAAPPAAALVGRTGVAHTVLRPAGVALVDGQRLDVVAESGMIERGSSIAVITIKDNNIVVRKV